MKVLHVISDLGHGGAPAVLASLVLADRCNEHVVVSLMDLDVFGAALVDNEISVYALGMPQGFVTWAGWQKLRQLIRIERPDVIQTWMYHSDLIGALAARSVGHRTVCWGIHNSDLSKERTPWRSRWVAKICALLSQYLPCRIISCSTQAAGVHLKAGYDPARLHVVNNGYDLSRFSVDADARIVVRQELGCSDATLVVGAIARWHPVKDHETLFSALALLPSAICSAAGSAEWTLALAGTGMTRENEQLKLALERHGLQDRVRLLGERKDVERVLAALDLHVLSSAGEAFPNALAEAMACGVPCVTTDVGDAALIVDDAKQVVPARQPRALARVIESSLQEVLRSRQTGELTEWRDALHQSIATRFSAEAMVAGYVRLWSEASA